jgi:Protein kinase domain/SET domain
VVVGTYIHGFYATQSASHHVTSPIDLHLSLRLYIYFHHKHQTRQQQQQQQQQHYAMSSSSRWGSRGDPRAEDKKEDDDEKEQKDAEGAEKVPSQQSPGPEPGPATTRKRRVIVDDDDSNDDGDDENVADAISKKQNIKKEKDDDDDDLFRDTPSPPPPQQQLDDEKVQAEHVDSKPPAPMSSANHPMAGAAAVTSSSFSSSDVVKSEAFQHGAVETTADTVPSWTIDTTRMATADAVKSENNNHNNMDMSPVSCYPSLQALQNAQDFEIMDAVEWGPGVKDEGYDSDQELAPKPKRKFNDPCGCVPDDDSDGDDDDVDGKPKQRAFRKLCCLDDSCINFATSEECRISCSAGRQCGNQRLQHPENFPPTQVFDTGNKGLGMRILQDVKKGTMIAEYTGRAVKEWALVNKLFQQTYQHERRLYIMALEDGIFLDARKKGGLARFINHSCQPNCRVERWKVSGIVRAAVVALCDISKLTELSFDYQWRRQRGRAPTKCYCGAPNCRGTLEVSKSMQEEELDKSLEGHWITKRKFLVASSSSGSSLDKRIVNRTIRVFSKEHQQYFLGEVTDYNPEKQLHQVLYQPDLKQVWEDLKDEEEWMILDETVDQPFRIAKKSVDGARRVSGDNTTAASDSLLAASDADRQGLAKNYLYVQTPVREALCCNPKNFMLENLQRNCAVQVTSTQFARPPFACNVDDPEDVEKYAALDKSLDGTVWKLSISGNNLERAYAILAKNTAFLEKKFAEQQAAAVTSSSSAAAVAAMIALTSSNSNSYHPPVPRPLVPDTAITITDTHEVIYPRMIADQVKRKLGAIRDKCRNVSISFAASESKSKRISRLMLEGSSESDLLAAKEELWNVLLALCLEAGAPMSKNGHGVPRDLGWLGGALSKEQFQLLLNSSNISSKADNNDGSNGQQSQAQQQLQRNNSVQYLNQHANEDFNQSPLLASFESFNKCAVWVQSEEDMGRIDSSHRIVAEANSTNLRKVYFGCHPSQVFSRWGQLQSRAADLARGVRFLYLGADRVYMGTGQQVFFDQVRAFTGAAVTVDNMTGDHLRVDGRDAILPIEATAGGIAAQPLQLGGALPRGVHSMSQEQRTSLAEEMVRLQIELYRDHCTREQNWLFGRDWTIKAFPDGDSRGATAVPDSSNVSTSANMAFGKLDNKSAAQSCMEIAEVVANLGLDKRVGAHAAIILYRFVTTPAMDTTNLKAREALLACVFLANKAQKLSKWRKLEAVLQAGYKAFYKGTHFDPEKEEALNLEEKVIAAEKEILIALEYDIFVREVDSLALALMNSMVKWKKKKEFVDGVFDLAFSGQMLGAGEELWVKYGLEYVFAAAAAFLKADLKALLSKLPLVPVKVCCAAELMTKSAKLGRPASKALPSHPLVEGGKELLEKYIPSIKTTCSEISDEVKRSAYAGHGDDEQRYRIITERNRRRSCIRGIPRSAIRESILLVIDTIATEYGCSIFVSAGSQPETDDIELVGSWRSVALADHAIRSKMDQGFYIPPAMDVSGEPPINPTKLPTKTKTRGGMLKANDIGLDSPENSDTFRLGGKSCLAGKISKDAVRSAGLQWWIFPKHGPPATGALCDSFLMRSNKGSELEALALLASSTVADLTAFPILASFGAGPSSTAGLNYESDDRMLAISVQRWPPEKVAAKEEKRIGGGKSKRRTMQMGFSAAALQEMQLLTQMHRLIPSPQGHPNFILPVGIAVPDDNDSSANAAPVLRDDPMFSLFRSSAENEKAATKEKQVKTFPHLVFQKTPFVLQKFLSRKHGVDDLLGSPTVVAAWCHDLISALVHCHSNQVLLRELQPDQVAVDHTGVAKLTSLYRSRVLPLEEREKSANLVKETAKAKKDEKKKKDDDDDDFQGNAYVAPEILLGCPNHSKATDCWTIGCILAHLLLSKSLFAGKDRSGLLLSQYKVVGTPAKKNFEDGVRLPYYSKPKAKYPREVEKAFAHFLGNENTEKFAKAINLIACMLHLDPAERCTATEALNHEFMVEFVENCNEAGFRKRYVTEWTALKQKLLEASESGLNTERRLKRKALLLAAAVDKDKDGDDLYDLDDILGEGAAAPAAKKRKSH